MEHSGLGSVMWVFGTRLSHFLYPQAPARGRATRGNLKPDTGAYSTRRRSDGAMRGGEGESSSAPLTVW